MTCSIIKTLKLFGSLALYKLYLARARPLPIPSSGDPVLILAPHPDDESFGCGGLISALVLRGHDVRILAITDGDASTRPPTLTRDTLAALRREELLAAASLLGCPPSSVSFLSFPDGKTHDCVEELKSRLRGCIEKISPKLLISPCPNDGHSDHVTIAKIVTDLIASNALSCTVLSYPVWFWPRQAFGLIFRSGRLNTLFAFDARPYLPQKLAAIDAHKTQRGTLPPSPAAWDPVSSHLVTMCTQSHELYFLERGPI